MLRQHIFLPLQQCEAAVFPHPHPHPLSLTCQHGVPAKFLALEERGKRPYHNVLIMRRQKQQTSWIVLIKYVWDLETQQLCVQVIQMHFNQLVTSMTFSDTPLRIFLNEILCINSSTVWIKSLVLMVSRDMTIAKALHVT